LGNKIRLGAVSYLNTKPLIYGFEQGMMHEQVELTVDYPARVAEMLKNGAIDAGLVPVAALPKLPGYHIVSDYCIGCNGAVASVGLFSEVPVNEIETVLLDYQSRTSVALLKMLLKEFWNIQPELAQAYPGYEHDITGTTAGLVIGDRAFGQKGRSALMYDLGTAWKEMTGLPFVFAVWASRQAVAPKFEKEFNACIEKGFSHLPQIIARYPQCPYPLETYYRTNIAYRLDDNLRKGLNLFLQKLTGPAFS
jgi:chorismate dehydratase